MRILSENPMLGVQIPSKEHFEKKEIRYFSDDEIKRFRTAALASWSNGSRIYPLGDAMILLLNTGVRAGEAIALNWNDYDKENALLHVHQTIKKARDRRQGEYIWKQQRQSTKTANG